uniref:Uncharacterized protein n=1 Tax=Sphaeramia orbicularis TaxID=375764 RepID=A0A673B060_9TELE
MDDFSTIITGCHDGQICLWDMTPELEGEGWGGSSAVLSVFSHSIGWMICSVGRSFTQVSPSTSLRLLLSLQMG